MDLSQRLDEMELAIHKPSFRKGTGRANEVNYWVFDYPPEKELEVRERVEYLKNKNDRGDDDFELEVLDDEFSVENNRNPISFIKTRIKKPNSIYNKLQKMGYEFTTENIQTYLNDVAGVRIVCAFIDDIYMISDLITQQDDIKVIEIKDYIKNPKSNGYRSYHMIVEIPVFFAKGKTPMRVELQIRTNGMDFWATLEHQLRYKKGIEEMPGYDEISEELLHSAKAIIEADNEMQRIKDKIGMFHEI